jgi:signal transduction histidine kinase
LHITNILVLAIPVFVALLANTILILIGRYVLDIQDYPYYTSAVGANMIYLGLFSPVIVLITIPLTNMFLTRFVIRKITEPIDMLSYGVHQIRDGNLSYRIEYTGNDEFSSICADFNEMAWRLNELVSERQKNEEDRKELISGISHDLRTPLTSIKAYVEGLEKGVASTPEAQRKYLDTIRLKTADMERIINQLFLFSKIDLNEFPLVPEKTNLTETLQELIVDIAEEYQEQGLILHLKTFESPLCVTIDQQQFRNVLMNVIENSLKYKVKDCGSLDIVCSAAGEEAVVTLTDDGRGVPEDSLDKLFTLFYREDASRGTKEGSGLGLAISAKMLERMGGRIRAQNAPEGGLSIIINLPLEREAAS